MIAGKDLRLRRLNSRDLKNFFLWLEEEEVDYYPLTPEYLSDKELEKEFRMLSQDAFLLIIETKDKIPIGYAYLANIQEKNGNAEFRIAIRDEKYTEDKYYLDAYNIFLHYFFNTFGIHKMYELIYEFEEKKVDIMEKMKIRKVGVLPEDFFRKGRFWDRYIYTIFAKDYYEELSKKL
jgi:RimJ/RimL family protein N-acetyltransferase